MRSDGVLHEQDARTTRPIRWAPWLCGGRYRLIAFQAGWCNREASAIQCDVSSAREMTPHTSTTRAGPLQALMGGTEVTQRRRGAPIHQPDVQRADCAVRSSLKCQGTMPTQKSAGDDQLQLGRCRKASSRIGWMPLRAAPRLLSMQAMRPSASAASRFSWHTAPWPSSP